MQKSKLQHRIIEHIGIEDILFDHSEWVTLWGFIIQKGEKIKKDFIISFQQLNELLRLSGKEGESIQMLLVEEMEKGISQPSILHLETALGHSAFFNRCRLKIRSTWSKNEDGHQRQTNCFYIEDVYPPIGNKPQNLPPYAQLRQSLLSCEKELAGAYELYLGYLELDLKEDVALRMAQLEDDLKFKMAYLAWKIK